MKQTLKERARQLKADIPAVYLAIKDPATPWLAKVLALVTIAYALSPIDLIPDFIPVLGYLDDIILLPFLIALTIKLIPQNIWEKSRKQASSRPDKKWFYAIPILLIWVVVIAVIWKFFHNLHLFKID